MENYFPLFQHMHSEHDLILSDSQMREIINICLSFMSWINFEHEHPYINQNVFVCNGETIQKITWNKLNQSTRWDGWKWCQAPCEN